MDFGERRALCNIPNFASSIKKPKSRPSEYLIENEDSIENATSLGLYADEIDELYSQNDTMLSFELGSIEDLMLFTVITRELGFGIRAFTQQNPFPVPEDD